MTLAIFDLDNTLIAGDSDHEWGEFLISKGIVDADVYKAANDGFYRDYQRGQLDINIYLAFALEPLTRLEPDELTKLHQQFMAEKIEPMMQPKALALIEKHRQQGDYLLIITATNRFVTGPIAERFGIHDILASEPEKIDGRYTGKVIGTPCFHDGKVKRLHEWLEKNHQSLVGSYFYSDSLNDIPLLEVVDNPVAVDADAHLLAYAKDKGWPVMSLRED